MPEISAVSNPPEHVDRNLSAEDDSISAVIPPRIEANPATANDLAMDRGIRTALRIAIVRMDLTSETESRHQNSGRAGLPPDRGLRISGRLRSNDP
jgi:hypothetical protein